jgi:hypothetical protein
VPQHLQLNFPNHMQLAQQALSDRFGLIDHIHYKSQPPRPLLEVKKWSLQTLDGWRRQQQEQQQQQQPALAGVGEHRQLQQEASPRKALAATASRPCADSCPRFCAAALQDLSLALGVAGLSLVRLVLDHTLLGDSGISQLATGIGKCSSLRQLSLCYCGIGAAGIKDLAAALAAGSSSDSCAGPGRSTGSAASAPAGASRLSAASNRPGSRDGSQSSSSAGPKLQQLLLSGNPLAGCGLQHLTPALKCMQDLQVSQRLAC